MSNPSCPYCQRSSEQVDGTEIYGSRPDLAGRTFYLCRPCEAWVGTHRGTTTPLGTLANADLRRARSEAHAAFDPLWKGAEAGPARFPNRTAAYAWLAEAAGLSRERCHIAMMDLETCRRVVDLVNDLSPRPGAT